MFGFSFKKEIKKPRIFIVEDNKSFLQTLKMKLKLMYEDTITIKGFTESETFLEEIKEGVEIVIMDFYLDDQSKVEGVELLQQIKKTNSEIFVLVLTGEEDLNIAKECFELGADSYMVKSLESLDKIVKEIHYKIELSGF
ncbi:MAG: two-component system response regulator YesN [Glaciecola sp.]|jgi:two-component system response regulator YesN